MKAKKSKQNIIDMLSQYDFRGSVILKLLREQVKHYESICRKLNHREITSDERDRFLSYAMTNVGTQADEVIDKLADEIVKTISTEHRKMLWKNLGITSVLMLPAIGSLFFYAVRHYFYAAGDMNAFQEMGYESFSVTLLSLVLLISMFFLSCKNEMNND